MTNKVKYLDRLNNTLAIAGGIMAVIMALLIGASVFSRYVLRDPIMEIETISGFLMLIMVSLGAAFTLQTDGHIKVDIVLLHVPSKWRAVLHLSTSVLGFVYAILLFVAVLKLTIDSIQWLAHAQIDIPLFPIYIFMPIGMALLIAQFGVQILGAIENIKKSGD